MLQPKSIRHKNVPFSLYASKNTLPVYPLCELSFELDGSHFTIISYSPSPSISPIEQSLGEYVYATASGVVPPAGTLKGIRKYFALITVAVFEAVCSTPFTTALIEYCAVVAAPAS
ncbi:MAG: hypothetical protein BWY22_01790 [Bacteroidetes bacterium ADurb.Bin217]|nr:MAG: hypothetical protein BWY22_01790 [Bacteroidetes bacterium ADurb.Bin217]